MQGQPVSGSFKVVAKVPLDARAILTGLSMANLIDNSIDSSGASDALTASEKLTFYDDCIIVCKEDFDNGTITFLKNNIYLLYTDTILKFKIVGGIDVNLSNLSDQGVEVINDLIDKKIPKQEDYYNAGSWLYLDSLFN